MDLPTDCNYYEIILMDGDKYDLGKPKFEKIMQHMKKTNFKFFEKQYKEYIIDDIIVHNYDNKETNVMRHTAKDIKIYDNYRIIGFHKTKLTTLNYPSTTYIYNILYVKKLIFRISNRIYINYEIGMNEKNEKTYKVYLNYNHDSNVDMTSIHNTLSDMMLILLA